MACKTLELFASLFSLPALSGTPAEYEKFPQANWCLSFTEASAPFLWFGISDPLPFYLLGSHWLTLEWRGRDLVSSTTNQHLTFFLSLFPPLAKESFSIWNLQCLFYLLWPSKVHPCIALGHRHRRLLSIFSFAIAYSCIVLPWRHISDDSEK